MHTSNVTGGKNITADYTVSNRVKQKEKEQKEYLLLNNMIIDNKFDNVDIAFLNCRKEELKRRLEILEGKKILPAIKLLVSSKAYPKRTMLGDLVYIIRNGLNK